MPSNRASSTHLVLIPSYNPGVKVEDTVRSARAQWNPVWVVVDGSTDGSTDRLQAMAEQDPGLRVIVLSRNRGKGVAVLAGLNAAAAQGFTHVLTMDSDGQHPAHLIPAFMAASQAATDTMVLGLPKFDASAPQVRVQGRRLSNLFTDIETLWSGIGDTIRVSLSADPVEEVKAGFDILKSLGLRHRGVNVISCPSCARQQFEVIRTVEVLEQRLAHITTPMTLSVIGCVVNGPGEARETDIGLTGGGNNTHMVYVSGLQDHRLKDADIVDHLVRMVEEKAAQIEAERSEDRETASEPRRAAS